MSEKTPSMLDKLQAAEAEAEALREAARVEVAAARANLDQELEAYEVAQRTQFEAEYQKRIDQIETDAAQARVKAQADLMQTKAQLAKQASKQAAQFQKHLIAEVTKL